MNELSLFTGAGGGLLGTHGLLGWRCVGAVEFAEYPCRVLRQRQKDGILNDFPIWNMDIREFNRRFAAGYTGMVDVISAGFPCQPFSVAGKQRGADDERNMWPATIECIRVVRPRFCLLESVPGLIFSAYLATIFGDLAACGYDARWRVLSAAELGAPHKRDRIWIVADAKRDERKQSCGGAVVGLGRKFKPVAWWARDWKSALCEFRGVDDGMAYGVERIDTIRNGQVPAVAATAWHLLTTEEWAR